MVSGTCVLLKKVLIEAEGECRAAALKGSMTHSFTHMGNLLLLLLDSLGLRTSSSDLSLQAAIWAFRLELGHEVGNWALWLGFGFRCVKTQAINPVRATAQQQQQQQQQKQQL